MFQPVRKSHTDVHTYNISMHVQCEATYDNTGVRDANCMFSKVQVSKVYTCSYSLAMVI